MRHVLSTLSLLVGGLLASAPVSAQQPQTAAIRTGHMGYFTPTIVASAMKADGIHITVGEYKPEEGFETVAGNMDLFTGQGTITTRGDVGFVAGETRLDMRDLQYVNFGPTPYISADVYANGNYLGRQTILTVTSGSPFGYMSTYGIVRTQNSYTAYTPFFITQFINLFQVPDLTALLNASSAGFVNFDFVTIPAPLPEKKKAGPVAY